MSATSGQPAVLLTSGQGDTAELQLFGATVTSYKKGGKELLWLSSQAIYNNKKAIRGGIPLVFPQFGAPIPSMPQHGFARNRAWKVKSTSTKDGIPEAQLILSEDEESLTCWPHKFCLTFTVKLSNDCLTTTLSMVNPADASAAFSLQCLQHTYLAVESIDEVEISGLAGLTYKDKVKGGDSLQGEAPLTVKSETDSVYTAVDAAAAPIEVICGGERTMKVEVSATVAGAAVPVDIVAWNPWIEKSKALGDY
ncbi:unnamed protein product, partial [Chrysoparadoxa australica]